MKSDIPLLATASQILSSAIDFLINLWGADERLYQHPIEAELAWITKTFETDCHAFLAGLLSHTRRRIDFAGCHSRETARKPTLG